jgi:acetyl-CoA C-acetyltransferase
MKQVVIVSAVRTPVGKFQGSLSGSSVPALGAIVVREAIRRVEIAPVKVDECIMGNVLSADLGQAPARRSRIRLTYSPLDLAEVISRISSAP